VASAVELAWGDEGLWQESAIKQANMEMPHLKDELDVAADWKASMQLHAPKRSKTSCVRCTPR
jgi:hypothetical protein